MKATIQNSQFRLRCSRSPRSANVQIVWIPLILLAGLLVTALIAMDYWSSLPKGSVATYVGRETCAECHQQQTAAFHGSDHDLAMDVATESSVLGDFSGVTLEHHGIESRMYRDGARFMIHTEGPDGQMDDFEVQYVFGVRPLQQYMVEFDRDANTPENAIARLQVLRISWDTAAKRWFYLDPPDVTEKLAPDDAMHWTGLTQRWNTMCAECHSTNLQKNFDPKTLRYHTTFSEIDVSCEACHGPASTHVHLARRPSLFWDRKLGYGLVDLKGDSNDAQIEACAPCHSRRDVLAEGFTAGDALCDFYSPTPLRAGLYFDDGQVLEEDYVYGSFTQSKMYHKGIRCTDCHDPHSLQLKAPGNQVCTSCHQHPAGKYDSPSHHKHAPGTAGSQCVDCHMPARTYMALDARRDHSLRIPRPDLSVAIGTPNACTGCHLDPEAVAPEKRNDLREYADWLRLAAAGDGQVQQEIDRADRWCDEACERWYGPDRHREPHFAEDLAAYRSGASDGVDRLAAMARDTLRVPAIARATALDELAGIFDRDKLPTRVRVAGELLNDPNPQVRAAAVRAAAGQALANDGGKRLVEQLAPMLDDPVRLVRVTAAQVLVEAGAARPGGPLGRQQRARLDAVLEELHKGLESLDDRGGAYVQWALLCEALGRAGPAIDAYEQAIRVEPTTVGPRSNLAALLERLADSRRAAGHLSEQQAATTAARVARLRAEELPLLERDARLVPDNGPLQYRLGLAYYLTGDNDQALQHLQIASELEPGNQTFAEMLRLLREKVAE